MRRAAAILAVMALPCATLAQMPPVTEAEARPGGDQTVYPVNDIDVFALPAPNLDLLDRLDFRIGSGIFRKRWKPAGAGDTRMDGLGPLYNALNCLACHIKDGRGHAPDGTSFENTEHVIPMIAKVAVPRPDNAPAADIEAYLASRDPGYEPMRPHPRYGRQIQDHALGGPLPEGRMAVAWSDERFSFDDGTEVVLRRPDFSVEDPAYGKLGEAALSPRITPQLVGLGLLEAIPEVDIRAGADPDDSDGDGISGRAQVTWSPRTEGPALGRFGWKAGSASVRDQVDLALSNDMGISTPAHPDAFGDCMPSQAECRDAATGLGPGEVHESFPASLRGLYVYAENIGVPARRDPFSDEVLRGRETFGQIGCADCHTPRWVTGEIEDKPQLSGQDIWPYTDLLLHDMGDDLADGYPEMLATGREWRTPPLWGLGLARRTNGREDYLHDGRARSLTEAILWHGGEGAAARNAFRALPAPDRDELIAFLESL